MEKLLQIKKDLILKIERSDDLDFLKGIKDILDMHEKGVYELTEEQQNAVNEGREQIARGEYIENEVLFRELQEWLQRK